MITFLIIAYIMSATFFCWAAYAVDRPLFDDVKLSHVWWRDTFALVSLVFCLPFMIGVFSLLIIIGVIVGIWDYIYQSHKKCEDRDG